jgi:hypothetical protein
MSATECFHHPAANTQQLMSDHTAEVQPKGKAAAA